MTFSLVIVQEMAARMGAVTGKGFSALIREKFGVRPTLWAMIALLTSNAATSVAEFAGIAAGMELFGVSKYVSVPIAAVVVWLLVVRGSYRNVEKVLARALERLSRLRGRCVSREARLGRGASRYLRAAVRSGGRLRVAGGRHDRHDHRTVDAVLRAEQHRRQGSGRQRPPAHPHRRDRRGRSRPTSSRGSSS